MYHSILKTPFKPDQNVTPTTCKCHISYSTLRPSNLIPNSLILLPFIPLPYYTPIVTFRLDPHRRRNRHSGSLQERRFVQRQDSMAPEAYRSGRYPSKGQEQPGQEPPEPSAHRAEHAQRTEKG